MTDNLFKTMPEIMGKICTDMVVDTLQCMRNDEDFQSLYEVAKVTSNLINPLGKPNLPRERKRPSYSILQYVTGCEGPESNAQYPETPKIISNRCIFKL